MSKLEIRVPGQEPVVIDHGSECVEVAVFELLDDGTRSPVLYVDDFSHNDEGREDWTVYLHLGHDDPEFHATDARRKL